MRYQSRSSSSSRARASRSGPCGPCPARPGAACGRSRCRRPSARRPPRREDPRHRRRSGPPCTSGSAPHPEGAPPPPGSALPAALRGSRTKASRSPSSGRSSVTLKKNRSAATAALMLAAGAARHQMQLIAAQILGLGRVGRAAEEGGEVLDPACSRPGSSARTCGSSCPRSCAGAAG